MTQPDTLRAARTGLLLLFLVALFNYMDRFVLSVLLPAIKADLELSDTLLGALGTAFTLSYIAFGIPLARIADNYSRKTLIAGALSVWSLMTALCGLAQNFIQLAIARVMVGVGEAGATPPAHSMISDYFPLEKRGRAISIYSLGAPFGIMIGFVAAGWIAENYSWRAALLSLGIPGLVLAAVVYFVLVEPIRGQSESAELKKQADESPGFLEAIVTLLSSAAYRHLCFATGLYTVVWLGVVSWLPSYFVRTFEMSLSEVGFWLAMSLGISQILGFLCGGVLTDFMVKRDCRWYGWIPSLAMIVSTPLFFLVFRTDNAVIATVALFPAFMIGVFQGPPSLAAVQGIAHIRMRAMGVAIFFVITNLVGGTIGPLLTGWLSDQYVAEYGDDSLRRAMLVVSLVFGLWAALHYALSTRTIESDINARAAAGDQQGGGLNPQKPA